MSNDLIALKQNLPAFLAGTEAANSDLTGHAGPGFPAMSIKGKVFTLVRGDERTLLMNPNDEDSPASTIEVIILKANPKNSKTYYAEAYVEGSDAKPSCQSGDGIKPDADAAAPQAKTCAACPHNVWGSRIGDNGSRGKACQDNARIAIAAPDAINDPMLLRIPPATLKPLSEYGSALEKRGVPYNAVVTKLGFDHTQATPKLTFKAVNYVSADQYAEVQEQLAGDVVLQIIGMSPATSVPDDGFEMPAGEPPAPAKKVEGKPAAAAKPKPAAAAKPKAPTPPPPEPDVEATNSDVVVASEDEAGPGLLDDIEAMLGALDD
jgi:hypothetical protein